MAHLIDKDALVAEIERLKADALQKKSQCKRSGLERIMHQIGAYNKIISFIGTLEVKEVDLEKELVGYHNKNFSPCNDGTLLSCETGSELTWYDYECIAKHFFELGIKAQQNISIDITNIDKVIEENGVDPNSKEAKMFKESYYIALEKLKAQKGE